MWLTEEVPGGVVKMQMESDMTRGTTKMHMTMTSTLEKFELGK
jgi:hypothetical protein